VPPHEVFGLRKRLAVAAGENCVPIAHIVDVDVPARNHSALFAARRGGKQLRGGEGRLTRPAGVATRPWGNRTRSGRAPCAGC
jgi:hypothetical protein